MRWPASAIRCSASGSTRTRPTCPSPPLAAARDFCLRLIEQTADLAIAYKPNAAFFELYGPDGWAALKDVIAAVPAGIPVILDAKRGDIASTADAYAASAFEHLGATAITLNPYLGHDSLAPFLKDAGEGRLPAVQDLQSRLGRPARPRAGRRDAALREGGRAGAGLEHDGGNVGPGGRRDASAGPRPGPRLAPDLWFLAPGVGAQGGDLAARCPPACAPTVSGC